MQTRRANNVDGHGRRKLVTYHRLLDHLLEKATKG